MVDDTGIPANVDHLALRKLADSAERIAGAFEAYVELKRQELMDEIQPHYLKPKPPSVWVACRLELIHLLDEHPFVRWDDVKENPVFRDEAAGNMKREIQWRRFLGQHAIPRKPEDGSGVVIIALDKPDKNGPSVATSERNGHCAQKAWSSMDSGYTWRWDAFKADRGCYYCTRCRTGGADVVKELGLA